MGRCCPSAANRLGRATKDALSREVRGITEEHLVDGRFGDILEKISDCALRKALHNMPLEMQRPRYRPQKDGGVGAQQGSRVFTRYSPACWLLMPEMALRGQTAVWGLQSRRLHKVG